MWTCPICGSREIGKISRERYFCGDCCNEWTVDKGEIAIYQIASDGSAVRLRSRGMGRGAAMSTKMSSRYPTRNVS
ncbi:hypothetical protein DESME_13790 [Desulfitobacterium metallireducens DSM 15288]|uniref:Uncharacterized protein n=1 Tax=Desulfitobacterium metallireducens DSM 15288 TaxID=871968 RepID=W0EEM8_9FIRM|nr:hypothetical protein DESME_13790 [Desulfitobacterium metallireducens DSM 15288]